MTDQSPRSDEPQAGGRSAFKPENTPWNLDLPPKIHRVEHLPPKYVNPQEQQATPTNDDEQ